jgi:hypothetical protein
MGKYVVHAEVTASVSINIEAPDAETAETIFNDNIMVNALLADVSEEIFYVEEDSICEIGPIESEEA